MNIFCGNITMNQTVEQMRDSCCHMKRYHMEPLGIVAVIISKNPIDQTLNVSFIHILLRLPHTFNAFMSQKVEPQEPWQLLFFPESI
jgi:hypothetical protein